MRSLLVTMLGMFLGIAATLAADAPPAAPPADAAGVVLDLNKSIWRFQLVRETVEILTEPGKVEKVVYLPKTGGAFHTKGILEATDYTVAKAQEYRLPEVTAADWMKAEYDDSQWGRIWGPPYWGQTIINTRFLDVPDEGYKLILARGWFEVADPAKCEGLVLNAGYYGGIVVYLNGEEVARRDMMPGGNGLESLGNPYPESAFLSEKGNGKVISRTDFAKFVFEKKSPFDRHLADCHIAASKLRKGANVLAVAVHRAPLDKACMLRENTESQRLVLGAQGSPVGWSPLGLSELALSAAPGGAVTPAVGPARFAGLRLWNQSITQPVFSTDPGEATAPLCAIRISSPRGGAGAALVVVGAKSPLKGLKAQVSELKGPAVLGATAVQVRWMLGDGTTPPPPGHEAREHLRASSFDTLAEAAPDSVAVQPDTGLALQPLWITVQVPADATPGDYSGTLSVSADGLPAQTANLKVKVAAWRMPAPGAGTTHMDLIESPESVAMRYGVELWSDAHLKLLDRTFELLAPAACKTLYVTAIRRTHLGNEQAMVRWVRDADGGLQPDLSVVEKYLDVASKRLGKIPSVILYAWEAGNSEGHAGNPNSPSRINDRPILLTLKNSRTGELREILGPDWGTPESKDLWGRLVPAMQKLLADRGMAGSLLIGMIGDHRPTKQAMDDMANAAPDVLFAAHSHFECQKHEGYKVGMCASVWGIGCCPMLPEFGPAGHGWRSDYRLMFNSRYGLGQGSPPNLWMALGEEWMGAKDIHATVDIPPLDGVKGMGRIGADFWPVIKDSQGNFRSQLCGRYPESYWGQLSLVCCTQWMLSPGPSGPLATVRLESLREGVQAMEACVVIDRAMVDKALCAKLGQELAARCAKFLDDRQRLAYFSAKNCIGANCFAAGVDWPDQADQLYKLAAEVADKTGQGK